MLSLVGVALVPFFILRHRIQREEQRDERDSERVDVNLSFHRNIRSCSRGLDKTCLERSFFGESIFRLRRGDASFIGEEEEIGLLERFFGSWDAPLDKRPEGGRLEKKKKKKKKKKRHEGGSSHQKKEGGRDLFEQD